MNNLFRFAIHILFGGFIWSGVSNPLMAVQDGMELRRRNHFEKSVRPVLIDKCSKCHGSDKQESGLRVDGLNYLKKGGDSGPSIVPGKPDDSLLLQAIEHKHDLEMPPEQKLPEKEILAIRKWIKDGAVWPHDVSTNQTQNWNKHWSFQKLRKPAPPKIKNQKVRIANEIDPFILKRVYDQGLVQADKADDYTLVRRAYFDLHGIGPTRQQVEQFVNDQRPDRFSHLVDRLLSSERYGERQARQWMDVARYADNKGYVFFEEKNYPWAYTYRDWLIRSFNQDMPFDQFILNQLAADYLATNDDKTNLPALGFLTVGAKFVNNVHDQIDDRIDVVTRGFMGLTVSCARCHDHKFDPIPQADYYSLYGVFRSCYEPVVLPTFEKESSSAEFKNYQKGLNERLNRLNDFVEKQRQVIMVGARKRISEYLLAVHSRRHHPTTENFMTITDKGAIIPKVILRYEVYLNRARKNDDPIWIIWNRLSAIEDQQFATEAITLLNSILADSDLRINPLVRAEFTNLKPDSIKKVAEAYGSVFEPIIKKKEQQETDWTKAQLPLVEALYGKGSPAVLPQILGWGFLDLIPDRPTQGEYQKLIKEVENYSKSGPHAPARAMVVLDADEPFAPYVFLRGNPNRKGKAVSRQFLTSLPATEAIQVEFPSNQSGRFQLAQSIASRDNPLTARVIVNRIWRQHFGNGLVTTPSDFGIQGSSPSHPELLDWLAQWLMDNDWSLKKLHKLIMCSETYQQSSQTNAKIQLKDPTNRWLSHSNQRRLEFEMMRDALVQATGSLSDQTGGKPFNLFSGFNNRRSLYGFINRMDLPGVLRTFDYPEPAATSAQREQTTVPAQALFFLNHPFIDQCAEKILSRKDIQQVEDKNKKICAVYHAIFAREPSTFELKVANEFLTETTKQAPTAWKYGYGSLDEKTNRVKVFAELPYFTGTHWQGGAILPDSKLNWLYHKNDESHPGASKELCSIRRWVAPNDGKVQLSGVLEHEPTQGNGVQSKIISSRSGELGSWIVHHSKKETNVATIEVKKGDTIDFVSDFHGNISYDQHKWSIKIQTINDNDVIVWDSVKQFNGPKPSKWNSFVHALLMTNEFMFVD